MPGKKNVLVIGRQEDNLSVIVKLIQANPILSVMSSVSDEEAMTLFENNDVDLVIICCDVPEVSEQQLREQFRMQKPSIKILRQYGEENQLLKNEIDEVIKDN